MPKQATKKVTKQPAKKVAKQPAKKAVTKPTKKAAARPKATKVVVEESLPCTVKPLSSEGRRRMRGFTLKDLEALCGRIRKQGGGPTTLVRIVRDAGNGNLRLLAKVTK